MGNWEFRYFGVSVSPEANRLVSAGNGIEESVALNSAVFNDDSSIRTKGGKFVGDSTADGGSYYFTSFDPRTENFYLQADITVEQINTCPDGQEGFVLMVRDIMGKQGVDGNWMSNLIATGSITRQDGRVGIAPQELSAMGVRLFTGFHTSESSNQNRIKSTYHAWYPDKEGVLNNISAGKTYRFSIEKKDHAYVCTQYNLKDNGVIGSFSYFIPAKDPYAKSVSSYDELEDPMLCQDSEKAYVALAVARGCNAVFSNIVYRTSKWDAKLWKPQPAVYRKPSLEIASGSSACNHCYNLIFRSDADGSAVVLKNGEVVKKIPEIKASEYVQCPVSVSETKTDITVEFTPDKDFEYGPFEKLSSHESLNAGVSVCHRILGKDGKVYVSPDGQSSNNGTSFSDATDLQSAFNHAYEGQTVVLEEGVYDFSGKGLFVDRGHNGVRVTTAHGKFATLDFGGTGKGFELWGNRWNLSFINITGTADGIPGMRLAGHNCTVERMNFYNNGTTGLQVSGSTKDPRICWPSQNTIFRCTSMNNADKALEDADGFAAKITLGEGNVFDQCISAYNADDGWDFFAKVSMGQLGSITVQNCVTYRNGYLRVKEGSSPTSFSLASISCDDNGTLAIEPSPEMQAGNGNGFKLGGSNLPGGHRLINSISFENLAKGIDSNSCPDIKVKNCVSFNNEDCNVGFYTGNGSAVTEYKGDGIVSFRTDEETFEVPEVLGIQSQDEKDIVGKTNFYWNPEKKLSMNPDGVCVEKDWFESLDTSVLPERNPDGSINMHGLLLLRKEVADKYKTGVTAL